MMNEFEFIKSYIAERRCSEIKKEAQKELKTFIGNVANVRNVFLFINDEVVKDKLKSQLERDIFSVGRYEHDDDDDYDYDEASKDFEISLVWDMEKETFVHNEDCNDSLDNLEEILRYATKIPISIIPEMIKATQNILNVIDGIVEDIYKKDKANLIQSNVDALKFKNASVDTLLPPIESYEFKKMFKRLNEHSYDTHMVIGLGKVQESYEPGNVKKSVTIKDEYKFCYELLQYADVLCINPKKRTFRCERHRHKKVIHTTGDIPFEDVDTMDDDVLRGFHVKAMLEAMESLDKLLEKLGVSNER